MTPLARVEAAILRLEWAKAESTPSRWRVVHVGSRADIRAEIGYDVLGDAVATSGDSEYAAMQKVDATLICLLHSTVDPMLELLRGAARYMAATGDYAHDVVLVLADAILGDTQ